VVFSGHPTWVPIRPIESRHQSIKSLCRTQLPLCLAYGLTIHKSQGLTFPQGCVVDFSAENQAPASQPGLAYVGMSRCTTFDKQGFRSLPDFWEFRAVLKQPIFLKRKAFEELMDVLHDDTMKRIDPHFSLESDIVNHLIWTKRKTGSEPSSEEAADIRQMLSQRGVAEPPWYSDEEEAVVKKRLAPGRGSVTRMGMRPSAAAAPSSAPASCTRRVRAKASAKKSAASLESTAESNSISPDLESLSQQKRAAVQAEDFHLAAKIHNQIKVLEYNAVDPSVSPSSAAASASAFSSATSATHARSSASHPSATSSTALCSQAVPKRRLRVKTSLPDPKRAKTVSDSVVDQIVVSREALTHLPGHLRAAAKRDSGNVIVRHVFVDSYVG